VNRIPVMNDEDRAAYGAAPTTDVGAGAAFVNNGAAWPDEVKKPAAKKAEAKKPAPKRKK